MNAPLPAFQQFQMAFGRRCRDPRAARPAGVSPRRMAVYEELLFNNITGFLDACFPVGRKLLGDTRWRRLNRAFFRDWRSGTPIFREIPQEFLRFLNGCRQPLPAWFRQLAHYEWVELAVDTSSTTTLLNLRYDWPVQHIGPSWRPRKPVATYLLVFRDLDDIVRFVETNAITARLVALLTAHECTGAEAIELLASEIDEKSALAVRHYGPTILDDLRRQGALLGVRT
jgi:uncharacterized protein